MSRWMADTSAVAESRYWQDAASASTDERLRQLSSLIVAGRELAEMGVRHRFPEASDKEVRRRVFELFYRRDFTPEQLLEWERRLGLLDDSDHEQP